jgi:hypothetical protein
MTARSRPASIALTVVASVVLLFGDLAFFARVDLFDAKRFADNAVSTLDHSSVRDATAQKITDDLVLRADPDLVAVRPIIEATAGAVVGTGAFKGVLRDAIERAHRAIFKGEDDTAVIVSNAGVLLIEAIKQFKPSLAKQIPKGFDARLVSLSQGGVATDAVQVAERVRVAGIVLPLVALLLFAVAVAIAPRRRSAVTRVGIGMAAVGVVVVVALAIARTVLLGRVGDDLDRQALGTIWDALLGDLRTWSLALAAAGTIVASASAYVLRPVDLNAPLRFLAERLITPPEGTAGRVAWLAGVGVAGLVMILAPGFVLTALVTLVGLYLLFLAVTEIMRFVIPPEEAEASRRERREHRQAIRLRWGRPAAAAAILAAAAALAIVLISGGGSSEEGAVTTCNGHRSLCDRRLDQVVFPATHNSYAGADVPGWVFPEQDADIEHQLRDGVRGLWIDAYYGIPGRRVYTDTSQINPALNAQLKESLGPDFVAAAARIRSQIARPPAGEKSRIYLCHGYCELGAVDAMQAFRQIAAFLRHNPGEVLLIDVEDYVRPEDIVRLVEASGLGEFVYRGPFEPPLPTLGEMIDSNQRVMILAEHQAGAAPWYRPAYSLFKETPFDFKQPSQMSCAPNRGSESNPLFLINHWINTDPAPKPSNAAKVNSRSFLLDRALRCERRRNAVPNAVSVDFYRQGDLFGAVDELNRRR